MEPPEKRRFKTIRVPTDEPNADQLTFAQVDIAEGSSEESIQAAFEKFDRENPHVFKRLVELTFEWYGAGHPRCAIGMLFEVLRWQTGLTTKGDEYMLNNNFRSRYARKIMSVHPELDGFFEVRELHAP